MCPVRKETIKKKPGGRLASTASKPSVPALTRQIEELQNRLREAEETLQAIREGQVDALVVSGPKGEQIFSLVGADSVYRLIVETMREAAFTVTFDGQILFCNAQFAQFVKRPMTEIVGRRLQEFVAEDERDAASTLLTTAQKHAVKRRLVFLAEDGGTVPAHISANVLNQPDGLSICVVAHDLTELENSTELIQQLRRQHEELQTANEELAAIEEELRVQNEDLIESRDKLNFAQKRYRDLFEMAPDGYVVTDSKGIIQEANVAAAQLLSISAYSLTGRSLSDMLGLGPAEREKFSTILAALDADTGLQQKSWEVSIRSPWGSAFWADVTWRRNVHDVKGNTIGLQWIIRDITKRKQAEKTLLASELEQRRQREFLECLITYAGVCIAVVKGHELRYTLANPAFQAFAGGVPMVGRTYGEVFPEAARAGAEAHLHRVLETGEPWKLESYCAPVPGIPDATWQGHVVRLPAVEGEEPSTLVVVWETTALKRAEESLKRQTERLSTLNKDLESFSYSVSHDLRAPLRAIDGYSRMILKRGGEGFNEETKRQFQVIRDNIEKMANLIEDLLAFSRLGKEELNKVDLKIEDIIREVWEELLTINPDRAMTLKIEPMPETVGDRALIRQVYGNLLGNAVKFSQGRDVTSIEVGGFVQDKETVYYVRDNGVGFDMKFYDKLFGVFQRLHSDEEYKGTGIGLALVKQIINRHGGRVWAESEVDKGATFYFTLPTRKE